MIRKFNHFVRKAQEELKPYDSPSINTFERKKTTQITRYSPETVVDIKKIIKKQKLDCTVDEFANCPDVDWFNVWTWQNVSEDFVREFQDKVDWAIAPYHNVSDDFIREFQDKVDWDEMSKFSDLSEDFIREFQDRVNWTLIGDYNSVISEDFIREFQDRFNWKEGVSFFLNMKNLSEDFIREFADRLDWENVFFSRKPFSPEFTKEMVDTGYPGSMSKYMEKRWIKQKRNK